MRTIILAGGSGTRLAEETAIKPKPMVEVGGRPMLWHIMKIYEHYGFSDFIIALGYKGEVIKQYFLQYHFIQSNLTVNLRDGRLDVDGSRVEDWRVSLVDTGLATQTGGRLKRLRAWLADGTFMLTYGDGVADIDIEALVAFHRHHRRIATVTAVRPPARFGALEIEGDLVTRFAEKPQAGGGWINGGFFVLEPAVIDYIDGEDMPFEREPLERLAHDRQLAVYRHHGFWQSMDTLRDVRLLNDLWHSGSVPWRVWRG